MKFKAFALAALLSTPLMAADGDYCLGEWSNTAQEYCDNVMIYAEAVSADRIVNRPKAEVLAEVPQAVLTYVIPEALAHNFIEYIYRQEPPLVHGQASLILIGGCIDNWETLQTLARQEITAMQSK